MARGRTVKYVIDADTSGFARGMGEAVLISEVASKGIKKNLNSISNSFSNNFGNINKNVGVVASSIGVFGNSIDKLEKDSSRSFKKVNKNVGAVASSVNVATSSLDKFGKTASRISIPSLSPSVGGGSIDTRGISRTAKQAENNFNDIRRSAATAASQVRNFGLVFQVFNTTSAIIGITALSGAVLELAGAFAAASSSVSILAPILAQASAATSAFKAGVFGLSDAFKAISSNDPKAFTESMTKLGPAAKQVALGVAGLNKAFNSIRLNTQQALLEGIGNELLRLGSIILPTVNAGFQTIGSSMNGVFDQAASLVSQPVFSGLLATVFADTARNIDILSGTLSPLLSIFTNLYLVTRAYVSLLAEQAVNILKNGAAYLSTTKGQEALNLAIQTGLVAIKQLGDLVGSVFGLLASIFRTSVNSGVSLIITITGIVDAMKDWVNSAKGQAQLIALFQFTSLVVEAVATALGNALSFFFDIIQAVSSLNPQIQQLVVSLLATSLVTRPVIAYFGQLYLAIRVLAVTLFNFAEQALVVFGALGGLTSVVLVLAVALVAIGAIIKGPLGSALILVGSLVAVYIGLSFLLTKTVQGATVAFWEQSFAAFAAQGAEVSLAATQGVLAQTMIAVASAGTAAGAGMGFAARAATALQASLVPLLVLAGGIIVILSMLGVFSSKGKQAESTGLGLGNSLGALQKSLKSVGSTGAKATDKGITPLSDALNSVGTAAEAAQGTLAGFDKMNVLTDNKAIGAGITGVPSLPGFGGAGGVPVTPAIDTTAFDKSLEDMQKSFDVLKTDIGKGFTNPFDAIGKFINSNPLPFLIAFSVILGIIIALFVAGRVAVGLTTLPLTLIVTGIIALIAIIILLVKNWDKVWATILSIASDVGVGLKAIWDGIIFGVKIMIGIVAGYFIELGNDLKAIGDGLVAIFQATWEAIKVVFSVTGEFFRGVWNSITAAFSTVGSFFGSVFSGAWNAVKAAFGSAGGFFQGVWNNIVGIFGSTGLAIGNAVGNAFKSAVNGVLGFLENSINGIVTIINGAIGAIDAITPGNLPRLPSVTLPRLAKGGLVSSPTVAQLGENGTEAIMPLENNTEWIDKLAKKININKETSSNDSHIASRLQDKTQSSNITVTVNSTFPPSQVEQRKIAEQIKKHLDQMSGYKTNGAF